MTLTACKPWLRCWLLLMSDLALRASTAMSIAPQHYDEGRGTITFQTKFGTWQVLPVTADLAACFKLAAKAAARRGAGTLVPFVHLLHPRGSVTVGAARQNFYRAMQRVGVERSVTPHDLRRSTAVSVLNHTRDIRAVQAVLGHKTLSSTLHYLDHRNTPVPLALLELAKLPPITEAKQ